MATTPGMVPRNGEADPAKNPGLMALLDAVGDVEDDLNADAGGPPAAEPPSSEPTPSVPVAEPPAPTAPAPAAAQSPAPGPTPAKPERDDYKDALGKHGGDTQKLGRAYFDTQKQNADLARQNTELQRRIAEHEARTAKPTSEAPAPATPAAPVALVEDAPAIVQELEQEALALGEQFMQTCLALGEGLPPGYQYPQGYVPDVQRIQQEIDQNQNVRDQWVDQLRALKSRQRRAEPGSQARADLDNDVDKIEDTVELFDRWLKDRATARDQHVAQLKATRLDIQRQFRRNRVEIEREKKLHELSQHIAKSRQDRSQAEEDAEIDGIVRSRDEAITTTATSKVPQEYHDRFAKFAKRSFAAHVNSKGPSGEFNVVDDFPSFMSSVADEFLDIVRVGAAAYAEQKRATNEVAAPVGKAAVAPPDKTMADRIKKKTDVMGFIQDDDDV